MLHYTISSVELQYQFAHFEPFSGLFVLLPGTHIFAAGLPGIKNPQPKLMLPGNRISFYFRLQSVFHR